MVLVKANKDSEAGKLPDEQLLNAMGELNERMVKAGVMRGGEGLHPSSKGTRVRLSNGKFTVTDGPFAESKELIAGFWVIDVASRDEAIAWMKQVPHEEGDIDIHEMYGGPEPPLAPRDESKRRYLSIYSPATPSTSGPTEQEMARMGAFMEQHIRGGALIGSGGLCPGTTPARVIFSGKDRKVVDGPFSEAKEVIGGYGILQTRTKDEVIQLAKDFLQVAGDGVCEIRPIYELSDFPQGEAIDRHARLREELARS
jgi:hypothetical protein